MDERWPAAAIEYHYYTTTASAGGSFSLPVKDSQGRDCMDDIGCGELYGGSEKVAVTGKNGEYDVEIYKTDDFSQREWCFHSQMICIITTTAPTPNMYAVQFSGK